MPRMTRPSTGPATAPYTATQVCRRPPSAPASAARHSEPIPSSTAVERADGQLSGHRQTQGADPQQHRCRESGRSAARAPPDTGSRSPAAALWRERLVSCQGTARHREPIPSSTAVERAAGQLSGHRQTQGAEPQQHRCGKSGRSAVRAPSTGGPTMAT